MHAANVNSGDNVDETSQKVHKEVVEYIQERFLYSIVMRLNGLSNESKKTRKVSLVGITSSSSSSSSSSVLGSIFSPVVLLSVILALSLTCNALKGRKSDQRERGHSSLDSSSNREIALPLKSSSSPQKITFGAILPATALTTIKRAYNKRIADTVESIIKGKDVKFNFTNDYVLAQAQVVLVSLNPSPNEVLSTLCNQLLTSNITTVIYMTNSDVYVQNTASAQYLMQLTGYLGIPMIAWNADNIGLEQVSLFRHSVLRQFVRRNINRSLNSLYRTTRPQ